MSTTPTLREAAQTLLDMIDPDSPSLTIPATAEIWARVQALLSRGAGEAVEPVAWMIWWGIGDMRPSWPPYKTRVEAETRASTIKSATEVRPVYAAPPAQQLQQAVARALEPVQQAIRDYHYALDTRQHGGVAQRQAFEAICDHLGMHWQQGQEAATRSKGTHD